VAAALQRVPAMNAHYVGEQVVPQASIDISVAVATPTGLITPIVVGADGLGLEQVSSKVRELATRAREGRLQPHEFMGGSFTISNLGMFGISEFSAIINPPQIAILAVGGGQVQLGKLSWRILTLLENGYQETSSSFFFQEYFFKVCFCFF